MTKAYRALKGNLLHVGALGRKALMRSLAEAHWKSAYRGNSLAAYPTLPVLVLRGRRVSNDPLLPAHVALFLLHTIIRSLTVQRQCFLSSIFYVPFLFATTSPLSPMKIAFDVSPYGLLTFIPNSV